MTGVPVRRLARAGRLLRALLSVATVAAVLAAVPVGLARFAGSPLPHSVPHLGELRHALTQPVEDRALLNMIVALTWLTWAYLALSLLLELPAALLHRPARLRMPGPGGRIAHRLVTGLVVASATVPALGGTALAATTTARPASVTAAVAAPRSPAAPGAAAAADARVCVVQPGDTLWDLAAAHLGDGEQWPRIFALNQGRPQPGGQALRDPDLILPGWRLHLPASPAASGAPAAASRTRGARATTSAPVPAPHHAAPPAAAPTTRPAAPAAPARGAHATPPQHEGAPDDEPDEDGPSVPYAAGGSVLFAAALLLLLGRARHQHQRRRGAGGGGRISAPPEAAARLETMLRVAAEPDDLNDLIRALDQLAAALAATTADPPPIIGARLRPGGVDLLLADPHPAPPPPFTPRDGGRTWTLRRADLPPERTGDRTPCPLPALVPIGRDDTGLLLLNLEHARAVAVTGSPAARTRLLTSIAAELVVAPWPTWVDLTAAALPGALARLAPSRIRVVPALDDAMLRAATAAPPADGDLAALRIRAPHSDLPAPHVILAATAPGEAMLDALAAATTRPGSPLIAVITGEWPAARWTVHAADDDTITVPELGLRLRGVTVTTDRLPDVAALLDHARRLAGDPQPAHRSAPARPPAPAPTAGDAADESAAPAPAGPVLPAAPAGPEPASPDTDGPQATGGGAALPYPAAPGAVSGEPADELDRAVAAYLSGRADVVRVTGFGGPAVTAPGAIESRRVGTLTELVVLLAAHPRGLHPAEIAAALWPGKTTSPATISATLCRARAWLGTGDDGAPLLPPAGNSPVRLSPAVHVDWRLFTQLLDRARRQPDRGPADLATALHLVTGRFLEHRPEKRYSWLADTTLEHDLPAAVLDAAHQLARHHLDTGNPAAAADTARIAQRADDCDERPWRDLMEAEAALGHPHQVAALRDQLIRRLDYEVEEDLSPETVQLLDRLLPRAPRRSAV
jgi:hypothetical protein